MIELALKAEADPAGVTEEDIAELKQIGVTDAELVELLDCMNYYCGNTKFVVSLLDDSNIVF